MRRPAIPDDLEPDLPRGVIGELRRHAQHPDDTARALHLAVEAIDEGDPARAFEFLEWAKQDAPRAPAVRESLGIARYLAEDWAGALSELQAYRRLSGRTDQNHLIADCLRALGRPLAMVAEAVREMDADDDGIERLAEARIVWASALADSGDVGGGRAVLSDVLESVVAAADPGDPQAFEVRLWYVAGDLAERAGEDEEATAWFERVAEIDPDFFDVSARLS